MRPKPKIKRKKVLKMSFSKEKKIELTQNKKVSNDRSLYFTMVNHFKNYQRYKKEHPEWKNIF